MGREKEALPSQAVGGKAGLHAGGLGMDMAITHQQASESLEWAEIPMAAGSRGSGGRVSEETAHTAAIPSTVLGGHAGSRTA